MSNSITFISQMLTPSVMISGIGFLLFNFNTHFVSLIDKIDKIDAEIINLMSQETQNDLVKQRISYLKSRLKGLIRRCKLTKYAVYILYFAMIFTILSVLALAAEIGQIDLIIPQLPIISFVISIILILISIVIEIYEMTTALKVFDDDFRTSL